ncbi:aromatic ring-hydroxylating dioxygenase subunit alpha [Rhodococcus sp. NPDC055024]
MTTDTSKLTDLVRFDEGLVNPHIFIDEDIYRTELDRLFGRAWLFLAHDSMIPNAHDFYATYMGSDPVLVTRQKDGSVRAMLNVCSHRGMKVCRAEEGNAKIFTCTYHGWAYGSDGRLVNVPNEDDAYFGKLPKEKFGLRSIRVETFEDFIFGTFDESAPPLEEYLGDMAHYLRAWHNRTGSGIEVIPGVVKWTIHGNWKLGAEQFAGDGYHAPVTHTSSLEAYGTYGEDNGWLPGGQATMPGGHGLSWMPDRAVRLADDPTYDYRQGTLKTGVDLWGPIGGYTGNFTVFPNLSGLGGSNNIRIWHPKGPNKFEIWSFTVVEKDAPDFIKREIQLGNVLTEGAAGIVETDDGENWDLIGQILEHGHQSRKVEWNYQMGLGEEFDGDEELPGRRGRYYLGEGPQRGFYKRWLEFMTSGDAWPHLKKG